MKFRIATASLIAALAISVQLPAQEQEEKAPKPPTYSVLYTFTGGADGAARPSLPKTRRFGRPNSFFQGCTLVRSSLRLTV